MVTDLPLKNSCAAAREMLQKRAKPERKMAKQFILFINPPTLVL
jgi:hypothetical protein